MTRVSPDLVSVVKPSGSLTGLGIPSLLPALSLPPIMSPATTLPPAGLPGFPPDLPACAVASFVPWLDDPPLPPVPAAFAIPLPAMPLGGFALGGLPVSRFAATAALASTCSLEDGVPVRSDVAP